MQRLTKTINLCVFALLLPVNLYALDGVRVSAGKGVSSTDVYKISLLQHFGKTWFDGDVKGHWELGFSDWDSSEGSVGDLQTISLAPVFVYDFGKFGANGQPYVECSVGLIYMNETQIADKNLGQRWQFDNRLGVGVRFGSNQRYDLAISVRHVSNAGTDGDNEGFDSAQFAYTYRFF